MNKIVLSVIALVILIGAVMLLGNKSGTQPATQSQSTTVEPTQVVTQSASPSAEPSGAMMEKKTGAVTLTANGFEPQTLTVKVGTTVVWTNNSGTAARINSDPHPTHTLWPFLNLGQFPDGGTLSVVFDIPGTYTYHNHLNPSQTGTVIVQ